MINSEIESTEKDCHTKTSNPRHKRNQYILSYLVLYNDNDSIDRYSVLPMWYHPRKPPEWNGSQINLNEVCSVTIQLGHLNPGPGEDERAGGAGLEKRGAG